jgi:hypothetical protein
VTKVLYIEHDDDNRYMLKMRLERADDFEVIGARPPLPRAATSSL